MAFRRPLKIDGSGNIVEMTDTDINNIRWQARIEYGSVPSVLLSVSGSDVASPIGYPVDSRKLAGNLVTYKTDQNPVPYPALQTAQIGYGRVSAFLSNVPSLLTSNTAFPAYFDSGKHFRAMTQEDVFNTFIDPAIVTLAGNSLTQNEVNGTYTVSSSTSIALANLISGNPIFSDTRETLPWPENDPRVTTVDFPFTAANYYLHAYALSGSRPTLPRVLYVRPEGNLQVYGNSYLRDILARSIRWAAANRVGYRIRYSIDVHTATYGNARGSLMQDAYANGSKNLQITVGGGASIPGTVYRRKVPDGVHVVGNQYYFRIYLT